ncbi:MAG TPA: glycosyltransferase [Lacipirellulaceae bacterium]|jgi:glycosyltransferase involved in cell wall biosynthesis
MISFIVPAHNEEAWVGRCVCAIRGAMEFVGEPYEVVVVDDASTDATGLVAREQGAQVIRVEHRQISATRNAGARQSRGEILFFVDADTLVSAPVIQSALRSIREGAVGGGSIPRFEGWLPLWFRLIYPFVVAMVRLLRFLPSGACMFCTGSVFKAAGGFNENYYAEEDALFVATLKRQGRFVVLAEQVITSGRKLRAHSFLSLARLSTRLILGGSSGLRNRRGLDYWYAPAREKTK